MSKPTPARYRTANWSSCNAPLKQRGNLMIWLDLGMEWFAASGSKPSRSIFPNRVLQNDFLSRHA